MIVRIMSEGQWRLADEKLDDLNKVDGELEQAVSAGDEEAFKAAFTALLEFVRSGDKLPDDELHDSDAILPPSDSSLAEMRELISGDGLIAG
ncbi:MULTISPECIES: PspA-associated protein PspAA [unclassified Kribbella]|uniref:PspA-associated protein PspAA n=1 Tax=unclassified Kribbella TaxID=2644121 RepID=UPI003017A80E